MKINCNPIKGTVDYLPKEMEIRQAVINKIVETYTNNGFLQIKTPILESIDLLCLGDSGDNQKMMFKTVRRGAKLNLDKPNLTEHDIVEEGLRYDLTVPLSRFYAKNREVLPYPFKAIQVDDVFRAEKPQKGRDRQFTQCDLDIWGEASNLGEIEIITTFMQAYKSVGLNNVVVKISDRNFLNSMIQYCKFSAVDITTICIIIDKLGKIGVEGCRSELLEKGFETNKVNNLINALAEVQEKGLSSLNSFGVEKKYVDNLEQIIAMVEKFKPQDYDIVFDISIVRGQGYYTGTVFESYVKDNDYKGAIGGGGRYDKMLEKYLGENVPAVGYGLGLVPTLMLIMEQNNDHLVRRKIALLFDDDNTQDKILTTKQELMKKFDVSIFKYPKNFAFFCTKLKNNNFYAYTKLSAPDKIIEL